MSAGTDMQKAALQELWPEIGAYCEAHGLERGRLMTGNEGIPISGAALLRAAGATWLTRAELASRAKVSLDLITKLINEKRSPTPAVLLRIVRALEVSPRVLMRPSDGHGGYG